MINQFSAVAAGERVRFFGNVTLGKDVSVEELQRLYHGVSSGPVAQSAFTYLSILTAWNNFSRRSITGMNPQQTSVLSLEPSLNFRKAISATPVPSETPARLLKVFPFPLLVMCVYRLQYISPFGDFCPRGEDSGMLLVEGEVVLVSWTLPSISRIQWAFFDQREATLSPVFDVRSAY